MKSLKEVEMAVVQSLMLTVAVIFCSHAQTSLARTGAHPPPSLPSTFFPLEALHQQWPFLGVSPFPALFK